ncbi:MAG: hypothetical protein E7364_06880 [Clostridiales bacterium]|nr:hypothetical protein [Clostridiales bacterium]
MKKFAKFSLFGLIAALAFTACLPIFARKTAPIEADAAVSGPMNLGKATGYTEASDVKYVTSGKYVANWGARDEDCVFLSEYAEDFYTGSYTYQTLSKTSGGTSGSNAPTSTLYKSLQTLMTSKQTYQTSYNATRDLFKYTDCVNSNYTYISSFYSGVRISGTWDGGSTWNREHTWPNSKGDASGNGENDITMLRPTSVSENSSRGNKAYGTTTNSNYYNPNGEGQNVRGDCARILLFVYTRWGNTSSMWGASGVIESLDVLLDWMEEDPVDTWEMGRNDAVQSITGTRNVFVDYPEYAFKLFGRAVPADMVTPSKASRGESVTPPTSEKPEPPVSEEPEVPPTSEKPEPPTSEQPPVSEEPEVPEHNFIDWVQTKAPTETEAGEEYRICTKCNLTETREIPALGAGKCPDGTEHQFSEWVETKAPTETAKGEEYRICTKCYESQTREIPALGGGTNPSTSAGGDESGLGCGATIVTPMFVTLLVAAAGVMLKKKEQ